MLYLLYVFIFSLLEDRYFIFAHARSFSSDKEILHYHSSKSGPVPAAPKVLLGDDAVISEFPWMVRVLFKHGPYSGEQDCSGFIVSNRHVMTAAHCCKFMAKGSGIVRAGEYNLNTNPDCKVNFFNWLGFYCDDGYKDYKVKEAIWHSSYDANFLSGDICILVVTTEIAFTKYVNKISLSIDGEDFSRDTFEGKEMLIAGWGYTDESRIPEASHFLLKRGRVVGVGLAECKTKWRPYSRLYGKINENHICAGSSSRSDFCHGDSGGPLMYKPHGSKTYAVGVAASGLKCIPFNKKDAPGVYTRIDRYKEWIRANTK